MEEVRGGQAGPFEDLEVIRIEAGVVRHVVSVATVLRLLRDGGLILPAHYQRERRRFAERRKAELAADPTGPNQF